jgi:membrane protein YqaA with SNARE-associated domain
MNLDESAATPPASSVPPGSESVASSFSDSDLLALLAIASVSVLCVLAAWIFGRRLPDPFDQNKNNKHHVGAVTRLLVAVFIIAVVTLILVSPKV